MKKLIILIISLIPLYANAQELKSDEILEYQEIDDDDDDDDDDQEEDGIFEIFDVSELAKFPGGEEGLNNFIVQNIKYPNQALDTGAHGTVYVVFVVNQDGSVSELATMGKKLGFGLEEEAIRVMKATSGNWKPAMQRDKAVRMRFRIPIKFQMY